MNKLSIVILIILSFISFIEANSSTLNTFTEEEKEYIKNKQILKVHAEKDWTPFNFIEDNKAIGYSNDYMRAIAKKIGLKIQFIKGYTWKEYMEMLKSNKLDVISNMTVTEERKKEYIFSDEPLVTVHMGLFSLKNQKYKNLEKLSKKKVAIVRGYDTQEKLIKNYPNLELVLVDSNLEALKAILSNKADAAIGSAAVLNYIVFSHFMTDIVYQPLVNDIFSLKPQHIGVAKTDKLLLTILNKAMQSFSIDEINKLKTKWINKNKKVTILKISEEEYLQKNNFNIYLNNWLPISSYDEETKEFSGLSLDYWNKIKELIPIKANLTYTGSFLNSLKKLKEDNNGVMISLSYTEERAKYGEFSKPYVSYPIGIATKDNQDFILDLTELSGKSIAVGKNYSAHKLLQKYYPKIKFVPVKNTLEALELLAKGKVYGAADMLLSLKYYLQEYSYSNLKVAGTSDFKFDIRIMVNKNNNELIPIINKAIDNIDENEKQLIQNKWIQTIKHVEKINYTLVYIILIISLMIVLVLLWRHKELAKYKNALEDKTKQLDIYVNQLEEKTKQLNDYVNVSTDYVWELDKNGIYTKVSDRVTDILGYAPNEIIGKSFFEFIPKDNSQKISEDCKKILLDKKPIENFQNCNIHKDGSSILLLTNGVPVFQNEELIGYRGTAKDITEDKQKDLIILEQSKMASMGEMIANIAHQWRQPLSIISTASSGILLLKELGTLKDEEIISNCKTINKHAQYLSDTIEIFRSFLKKEKTLTKHSIESEIFEAITIVNATLQNKYITLKDNIDYECKTIVNMVENELSQVIINILNNAKDIIIERKIKTGWIEINLLKESKKVIISIEDNGGGIPTDILSRIFEPYITTKHKSQGTGLGLHISYKIVTESLKGNLYAKNTKNGAKLIIEIPI